MLIKQTLLLVMVLGSGVLAQSGGSDAFCNVHLHCQRTVGYWSYCRPASATSAGKPTCALSGGRVSCAPAQVCPEIRAASTTPGAQAQQPQAQAPSTNSTAPATTTTTSTAAPRSSSTTTTAAPLLDAGSAASLLPAVVQLSAATAPVTPVTVTGCAKSVGKTVGDFFVWTEWPSVSDADEAEKYYAGLLSFLRANCAGLGVTRVVLRVLHPQFPWKESSFYTASTNSVLHRAFLSKLPENVELVMYGYVMESPAIEAWKSETGTATAVEGVVAFMKRWNDLLGKKRFRGVVFDLEEFPAMQKISPWTLSAGNIASLKSKYGDFEFGTTIGFDQLGVLANQAAMGVDKLYLQIYDLYHPYAYVGATKDSRFLVHKNDAATMGDFILNTVLAGSGSKFLTTYSQYADKVMLMWSNQNLVGTCLYPLDGKNNCGANYEFGVWDPDTFNAFMNYVKSKSPVLNSLKHGLFQYSFTPPSWVPATTGK